MAVLEPAHALAYLGALSADLRAGAVLDARGDLLAGDPDVADAALALVDASVGDATSGAATPGDGAVRCVAHEGGTLTVRRGAGHTLAVHTGPHALPGVVAADLTTALGALA